MTDSQPLSTYAYNTSGERVEKVTADDTNRYITAQGQVVAELNGSGSTVWNYVYGNGRRLANAYGPYGLKYYYHNDMLGSVRRLARQNKTEVYERDYYPYGSDRAATGASHLPGPEHFKFISNQEDVEFGLYYFGARYYPEGIPPGRSPAGPLHPGGPALAEVSRLEPVCVWVG